MALADAMKAHAASICKTFGETIEYRSSPSPVYASMLARVRRNPVDPIEGVLQNVIQVFVSKTALVAVSPREDMVRLSQVRVGEDLPVYRVTRILEDAPGFWLLEAVR